MTRLGPSPKRPTLVLYHRDADGMCAAWLDWRWRLEHNSMMPKGWETVVEYRSVDYGQELPAIGDLADRSVLIYDPDNRRNLTGYSEVSQGLLLIPPLECILQVVRRRSVTMRWKFFWRAE